MEEIRNLFKHTRTCTENEREQSHGGRTWVAARVSVHPSRPRPSTHAGRHHPSARRASIPRYGIIIAATILTHVQGTSYRDGIWRY